VGGVVHLPEYHKKILLAALAYFASVAVLLSFLYWFLKNEGFNESNSHLLAPKAQLDANLSQLSNEILHELNIPLSTIKANTAMLRKRLQEEEKSLKRLDRIEVSSERLERLYEELAYSIKKEIHPIEKEHVVLQNLLLERVETFALFGRNRFKMEVDTLNIMVDRIGFEKMIDNLLMNAMKYSPKDTPVTVVCKDAVLAIRDKGVGMDEAELLRVYERYYQGDSKNEGKGIGLALVKAYCDTEGMAIQILSRKGEGTSVLLDLRQVTV